MTLSREQFADALRKGLGRARAHVREHGDAGVEDLLLEACLHDLTYDQQSEGNRGAWLMTMLALLPDASSYHDAVLAAFVDSTSSCDVDQMASMVRRMAEQGTAGAKGALYAKFDRQEFDSEWTIAPHLVVLDHADGLLHVARVFGRRLATDSEFWLDDTRSWFEEELGRDLATAVLNRAAERDEDVRRFRDAFSDRDETPKPTAHSWPNISLDDFLAEIDGGKKLKRASASRFGRGATEEQLAQLLHLIAVEADPARLAAMLWVFRRRKPSGGSAALLPYARHQDAAVQDAAIEGLAQFADDAIADLASQLLDAGSLAGVRLLGNSPVPDQYRRVVGLLPANADADTAHGLGMDLMSVDRGKPLSTEQEDWLLWIYEHTPCSYCRNCAVEDLIEIERLSPTIAAECRDDCNYETRELVG